MSDPRNVLNSKFDPSSRFANFGNVLEKIHVSGFRIHANTVLDFKSPITAICGLNGTGKSTILQIAAAAYKNDAGPLFYLKKFFVVSKLDPTPYTNTASVVYSYCERDGKLGQVTISRNTGTARKGWAGYKRRRTRHVFYGGVGMFIPKVEKRDFLVNGAAKLEIDGHDDVLRIVKQWVSRIIGRSYDEMHAVKARSGKQNGRILRFNRNSIQYSESHMGFGEGRIAYLVEHMESMPEKSLVLLEEPETSLHPSAQHQLGAYFMDVCDRRGHQIILTTHSEYLLRALPSASRVYFHLADKEIEQIWGLTASRATSLMTEGHDKALVVLVEDICAKSVLTEMIRRTDSNLLRTIHIEIGGGCDSILTTMGVLKKTGIPIAAVLDGDQTARPKEGVFILPGGLPPEKVVLSLGIVQSYLKTNYGLEWSDFAASEGLAGVDHHDWIPRLAFRLSMDELSLTNELARAAVCALPDDNLTQLLKESLKQ